ncbi:MAG: hypothetical protein ACRD0P_03415 [Stackebrandtia sp.]
MIRARYWLLASALATVVLDLAIVLMMLNIGAGVAGVTSAVEEEGWVFFAVFSAPIAVAVVLAVLAIRSEHSKGTVDVAMILAGVLVANGFFHFVFIGAGLVSLLSIGISPALLLVLFGLGLTVIALASGSVGIVKVIASRSAAPEPDGRPIG